MAAGQPAPRIRQATSEEAARVIERLRDVGMMWEDVSPPRTAFLIATDRRDIVGFVRLELDGTDALLGSLYVEPEYRRLGLAGQLVAAVEVAARRAGATRLLLFTVSTADYFRSLGYQDIDTRSAVEALQVTPQVEWYVAHPEALAKEAALSKRLA